VRRGCGWRWGWLLLLCWGGWASGAPLVVGEQPRQSLADHLELLLDPTGELDLAAVQAAQFQPAPSAAPGLGYRTGAVWARIQLVNGSRQPQPRWLVLQWPFQQSCTLWLLRADGRLEHSASGAQWPVAERPLPSRQILFPISLESGEQVTLYLRLAGRSATVADFALWRPAAYADALQLEAAVKYLLLGSTLVVVIYSVLGWQARQRVAMLGVGAAQLLLVVATAQLDGFGFLFIPAGEAGWPARLLNLCIVPIFFFHLVFIREFLHLPQTFPRLARVTEGLALLTLMLMPLPLLGVAPALIAKLGFTLIFCLSAVSVAAAMGRVPGAGGYLLAWGGLWGAALVRSATVLGLLPQLPFSSQLPLFGVAVAGAALSYSLHQDIRRVRLAAETDRLRLQDLEQGERERLAAAVDRRTRELDEALARAESANRAKSAFLSMVSHELRTPLHTILGYTRLLRKQSAEEVAARLAIVENSGNQLLRLIEDVLEFSRGEMRAVQLSPEPLALRSLAEQLEEASRPLAAERGNQLAIDLQAGLPVAVEVDEQRLGQVLLNLLANACKYTEQGRIWLRMERLDAGGAEAATAVVRFAVEDNGIGIAPKAQAQIFEPFFRVVGEQRQSGVGLGLAIARQLVRVMGGEIELESTPGQGSRFHFSLTLPVAEEPLAQPLEGEIIGTQGSAATVLVVDDTLDHRTYLHDLCSSWGLTVETAADGAEALARCLAADPPIQLAVVDQVMPEMDGWALLRAVRSHPALAAMPLILVSAAAARPPADLPSGMKFDAILAKPIEPPVLAALLQRYLHLEWQRRPVAAAEETSLVATPLRGEQLAQLRQLVTLGQVTALPRWADALAAAEPCHAELARQLKRLCRAVDLAGLRRLLDQLEAQQAINSTP